MVDHLGGEVWKLVATSPFLWLMELSPIFLFATSNPVIKSNRALRGSRILFLYFLKLFFFFEQMSRLIKMACRAIHQLLLRRLHSQSVRLCFLVCIHFNANLTNALLSPGTLLNFFFLVHPRFWSNCFILVWKTAVLAVVLGVW